MNLHCIAGCLVQHKLKLKCGNKRVVKATNERVNCVSSSAGLSAYAHFTGQSFIHRTEHPVAGRLSGVVYAFRELVIIRE